MNSTHGWRRLAGTTAGGALQRGLGGLVTIFLIALASRGDGLDVAGQVGVAIAAMLVVAAVADFGTTTATLRDFGRARPSRENFAGAVRVRVTLAAAGGLVLALAGVLSGSGGWAAALAVVALALPAIAVTGTATSKLVNDGDGATLGAGALCGFVVGVAVGYGASLLTGAAWALLIAVPAARAAEAAVLLAGCRFPALVHQPVAYDWGWLRAQWPLALSWALQAAYLRSQLIVPGIVLAAAEAGEVANGFNLFAAGALVPGAAALAAWPYMTGRAASGPSAARLGLVTLAVAVPVALVLLAAPGPVLDLVAGSSSGAAETYVRFAALAMLLQGPNAIAVNVTVAAGRSRFFSVAWALAFIAAVALYLGLGLGFGTAGCGAALLLSELTVAALFALGARGRAPAASAQWPLPVARLAPAAVGLALAGGAAAAVPFLAETGAFPSPREGLLLLVALPFIVLAVLRAARYDLMAPAAVFALGWSTGLAVAQLPLYPSFNWGGEMWVLVTTPPLVLVAFALLATGPAPVRSRLTLGEDPAAPPAALVAVLVLLGIVGWAVAFAQIGSIPLLSNQIDAVRFNQFSFGALVATRAGQMAFIVALLFAALRRGRARLPWLVVCALTAAPLVLSAGRLYLVASVASAAIAFVLVRGVGRRSLAWGGLAGVVLVFASASLWFYRIDQQADNPFKLYLEEQLAPSRPAWAEWTIPVQLAAAGSLNTLSDLVESGEYKRNDDDGLYSFRALDRFVPAKDLESVARRHARFGLITSTYLGDVYADFGLAGALIHSAILGIVYGLLYRWYRSSRSFTALLFYSYWVFWLVFAVYLGYWQTHGVWIADVPFLLVIGKVADARRRPVAATGPGEAHAALPAGMRTGDGLAWGLSGRRGR